MTLLDALLKRTSAEMQKPGATMRRAIATAHTAAYYAGIKERTGVLPKGLSKIERAELKKAVAEQLKYYDKFADAAEGMTEKAIGGRAQMYASAVKGTYYGARYPGLTQVPGDGQTSCLTRCLCSLEEKDDGIHWILDGGEHCEDCQAMAAGGPYGK